MKFKYFDIVVDKLSSMEMIIVGIGIDINGEADMCRCRYYNKQSGEFEYIGMHPNEIKKKTEAGF